MQVHLCKKSKSAEDFPCPHNGQGGKMKLPRRLFVNGENFAKQLEENPEATSSWTGKKWSNLVAARPEYADRCPWEIFDGQNWALVLNYQPQFADKCDWAKLDWTDWDRLLEGQPQFADRKPENLRKPEKRPPSSTSSTLSYVSKEIKVTMENGKIVSIREREVS